MQFQRRSIRLRGYDYTQPGAYFVTVCCDQRQCVLGEILADGALCPSPLGLVVHDVWKTIPDHFPSVRLGPFVVMPNHIHGILFFLNEVGAKHASPLRVFPRGTIPASLSAVMQSFKSAATRAANRTGLMPIGRLWQRGFFERVIRTEEELGRLQSYIEENPLRWAVDREDPDIS